MTKIECCKPNENFLVWKLSPVSSSDVKSDFSDFQIESFAWLYYDVDFILCKEAKSMSLFLGQFATGLWVVVINYRIKTVLHPREVK